MRFHPSAPAYLVGAVVLGVKVIEPNWPLPAWLSYIILFCIAVLGTEVLELRVCGACGSEEVVPPDSPRATEILRSNAAASALSLGSETVVASNLQQAETGKAPATAK